MKYSKVTNLVWANAAHTEINCDVFFDDLKQVVPFTASDGDVEAHSREIFTRAFNNAYGPIADYVEPAPPVPQMVTPLQARKAIRASGLKPQVDAYIASLPDDKQEEWEYCISVNYSNGLISEACTALGLTEQQKADLFRLAATYE